MTDKEFREIISRFTGSLWGGTPVWNLDGMELRPDDVRALIAEARRLRTPEGTTRQEA